MRKIHNLSIKKNFRKTLRNSATPQEVLLWSRLRRNQLGHKFRRQHSIGKYIVDFYCPDKKMVIEIDGSQHMDNSSDIKRTAYLEDLNFMILRFWDNEINNNLDGVLLKIMESIE